MSLKQRIREWLGIPEDDPARRADSDRLAQEAIDRITAEFRATEHTFGRDNG